MFPSFSPHVPTCSREAAIIILTCFHASFFPFCPLCWPSLFLPFSRHLFALFFQESPRQTKPKKGQFMKFSRGKLELKFDVNLACFTKEKTPEFTKMGDIHELFVLALSLVWFAGATADSSAPRKVLCCVERRAQHRVWRGAVSGWTSPQFGKEIPSRNLREKWSAFSSKYQAGG